MPDPTNNVLIFDAGPQPNVWQNLRNEIRDYKRHTLRSLGKNLILMMRRLPHYAPDHVLERGMACSVYGAQYLLEALFLHGKAEAALALMTASGDRSWRHMLESGATITWEAWDHRYKPNLDWNHAWGAAPANLLPRYVAGVRVDGAGGSRIAVQPETGGLRYCSACIPTMRGPVEIEWSKDTTFRLCLAMPSGMAARLILPAAGRHQVRLNGQTITPRQWRGRLVLPGRQLGTIELTVG